MLIYSLDKIKTVLNYFTAELCSNNTPTTKIVPELEILVLHSP